jgi:hypothetical protein
MNLENRVKRLEEGLKPTKKKKMPKEIRNQLWPLLLAGDMERYNQIKAEYEEIQPQFNMDAILSFLKKVDEEERKHES